MGRRFNDAASVAEDLRSCGGLHAASPISRLPSLYFLTLLLFFKMPFIDLFSSA